MSMFHPLSGSEANLLEIASIWGEAEDLSSSSRPATPALLAGHFVTTVQFGNTDMNSDSENRDSRPTSFASLGKEKHSNSDGQQNAGRIAGKDDGPSKDGDSSTFTSSGPRASPQQAPSTKKTKAPNMYDPAGNLITTPKTVTKGTNDNDDVSTTPNKDDTATATDSNPSRTTSDSSATQKPTIFTSTDRITDTLSSAKGLQTTVPSIDPEGVSTSTPIDSSTKTNNGSTADDKKVSTDLNIIIIGGKVKNKDKKDKQKKKEQKAERKKLCPESDFNSIPGGRKCCLKSAKCFQNLPDDLEEFDNRQPTDEFDAATACKEIDDALLCMSNVFINFDCHQTADIVNRNLNKELQTVRKIYSGHCKGQQKPITTTAVVPGNQNSQNQSSASTNQDLPASALIGVAVGGLLFVAIFILIIVLLKRRKNPRDTESNKVVFENNSDDSSRYKSFTRRNSDVYAEIDDRALQRSIRLNNNKDLPQSGEDEFESRPLPNAPSTQLSTDDNGYLTPESSRRLKREMGGYDQLSRDIRDKHCLSQTYDKLESDNDTVEKKSGKVESDQSRNDTDGDGEYITPPGSGNPPKSQTEENCHMYFVLEKQTG